MNPESTNGTKFYRRLFAVLLLFLHLPLLQFLVPVYSPQPLNGDHDIPVDTVFTWESWISGRYQANREVWLDEFAGFRSPMVRLHHQLEYSLFRQPNARNVLLGEDGYLFEKNYIEEELGLNFRGRDSLLWFAQRWKTIQDSMRKLDKPLILMVFPGKGTLYPEYFPARYQNLPKRPTNASVFMHFADSLGVEYLDLRPWVLAMKDTARYPLFPRNGIHWCSYMDLRVADTMTKYLRARFQRPVAGFVPGNVQYQPGYEERDYDIATGMNLFFQLPAETLPYPEWIRDETQLDRTRNPRLLVIGDSYYFGIFNKGYSELALNKGEFWYYHRYRFGLPQVSPVDTNSVSYLASINNHQGILFMVTDANFYRFDFGFSEQLLKVLTLDEEEAIEKWIHAIRQDKDWVATLKKKADENQITLDEQIRNDAWYMRMLEKKGEVELPPLKPIPGN